MKKLLSALTFGAFALFAIPAHAVIDFGIKGGVNVTNMSMDNSVLDASNRSGFFFGPMVKFTLPLIGLGFDASALYDQRDAVLKSDEKNIDEKLSQKSIQIPINVRYGVGLGSLANVFVFAGPQFGFNVGDKVQTLVDDALDWRLKDSNLSVNIGLGATVASHLQVTANYNIACGKSGEASVTNTLYKEFKGDNKSNAWQISLAYFF